MTFTTPRVFDHPLINALECFGSKFALRQLPEIMDGEEWSVGVKRYVSRDVVGGFLVPRPSDDESDPTRLHRVQSKICRFVSVVHAAEVVHILEGHSEDAVAGEVDS